MGRFGLDWAKIRDSLWFLPALLTLFAAGLAIATLSFEGRVPDAWISRFWWLFGAGPDGARGVLSTIAGGIITVTGVVFSITIVALQLASTQYSPLVLRRFMSDPMTQITLGAFIGTFVYTIMVLRTVRAVPDGPEFVPSISVTIAVILAVLSIGVLIFFIDHTARAIQASTIIDRVTEQTLGVVRTQYPARFGRPADKGFVVPSTRPAWVRSERAGYVQAVDLDRIFDAADGRRLTARIEVPIGEFVLPGRPLIAIWPAEALDARLRSKLVDAFRLGHERTQYADLERGLIELVEIAVKALSPSSNDPSIAVMCIQRLGEILAALGRSDPPDGVRVGPAGRVHVIASPVAFDAAVRTSYTRIRHHGAREPTVAAAAIEALQRVAERIPTVRHDVLAENVRLMMERAEAEVADAESVMAVRRAAEAALAVMGDAEEASRARGGERRSA